MVGSKIKKVKQKESPIGQHIVQLENPESYYDKNPSWNFYTCDTEYWQISEERIGSLIWSELLPYLKDMEKRTWSDILISAKKQNHSIDTSGLNIIAQKRLIERYIEQDSIISLRITGTHRLYGYISKNIFYILWYDLDHGDNENCVCRSRKKHT